MFYEGKTGNELTLDEVYLQNKKMIKSQRSSKKSEEEKKESFFLRFFKEMNKLFFEKIHIV